MGRREQREQRGHPASGGTEQRGRRNGERCIRGVLRLVVGWSALSLHDHWRLKMAGKKSRQKGVGVRVLAGVDESAAREWLVDSAILRPGRCVGAVLLCLTAEGGTREASCRSRCERAGVHSAGTNRSLADAGSGPSSGYRVRTAGQFEPGTCDGSWTFSTGEKTHDCFAAPAPRVSVSAAHGHAQAPSFPRRYVPR